MISLEEISKFGVKYSDEVKKTDEVPVWSVLPTALPIRFLRFPSQSRTFVKLPQRLSFSSDSDTNDDEANDRDHAEISCPGIGYAYQA